MPFMHPKISAYIDAFQTGAQPFTPQAYRNLQSMLANEISKGGNEGAAARIARRAGKQPDAANYQPERSCAWQHASHAGSGCCHACA